MIGFRCSFRVHTSLFDCQALAQVLVSCSYFEKDPATGQALACPAWSLTLLVVTHVASVATDSGDSGRLRRQWYDARHTCLGAYEPEHVKLLDPRPVQAHVLVQHRHEADEWGREQVGVLPTPPTRIKATMIARLLRKQLQPMQSLTNSELALSLLEVDGGLDNVPVKPATMLVVSALL